MEFPEQLLVSFLHKNLMEKFECRVTLHALAKLDCKVDLKVACDRDQSLFRVGVKLLQSLEVLPRFF